MSAIFMQFSAVVSAYSLLLGTSVLWTILFCFYESDNFSIILFQVALFIQESDY